MTDHFADVNKMVSTCTWNQDQDYGDSWNTQCGKSFLLNDGSPHENGLQWCGFCGRPLEEQRLFTGE